MPMDNRHAGPRSSLERDRCRCARLAAGHDGRDDHLPAVAHGAGDAARQDEVGQPDLQVVGLVGRGRRARGGARRDGGDRRLPARLEALREARRARAEGNSAPRAAGNREDAPRQGGRPRVRRELLLAERLGLRRDVRRARRGPHPQALRAGAQGCACDRVHRRARRGRRRPQQSRLQPRAGSDAEPAARRARRLQQPRPGDRDGRFEPAPGSRPGSAPSRAFRPADPRLAARPRRS